MKKQQGYVALIMVLTISAVALATATSAVLLSIGEAQSGLALSNGENNLNFDEGCMEDALLKFRASASYAGGTITRPEGTCTITVSKNVTVWTITATTTSTAYKRTIQAVVTRSSTITITSWQEI